MVVVKRIMGNIQIDENSGCWNWRGSLSHNGYGGLKYLCEHIRTHRYMHWFHSERDKMTWNDFKASGLLVCHKCDNPKCCNPEHLFSGTNSDNMQDSIRKNRFVNAKGEHHSKLTEEQVKEIYQSTEVQRIVAEKYGVSQLTVSAIKNGQNWAWLTSNLERGGKKIVRIK